MHLNVKYPRICCHQLTFIYVIIARLGSSNDVALTFNLGRFNHGHQFQQNTSIVKMFNLLSCVPYVASFSGMSLFYCPFGILHRLFIIWSILIKYEMSTFETGSTVFRKLMKYKSLLILLFFFDSQTETMERKWMENIWNMIIQYFNLLLSNVRASWTVIRPTGVTSRFGTASRPEHLIYPGSKWCMCWKIALDTSILK
jgi:hypothetical protein